MENQTEITRFLDVMRRRRRAFLLPFFAVLAISTAVVLRLPSIYKSQGTILIEAQEIPQNLVQPTVTGYIEERLQALSQVVLSRRNLHDILKQHNPYPDLTGAATADELLEKMRQDIAMTTIQTDVVDPRSGRPSTATVAFSVSYENRSPAIAADVANRIISLFLEENLKSRQEKTTGTYEFLEVQLGTQRGEIEAHEARIAQFKASNLYSLPELTELNLTSLDRTQKDLDALRGQVQNLTDRKVYLEGQLATLEPVRHTMGTDGQRTMTLQEEIKVLRSKYLTMKASASEKHPDVIRLRSQLEALEREAGTASDLRAMSQELQSKRAGLAALGERYAPGHPDVQAMQRQVDTLAADIKRLSAERSMAPPAREQAPENPAYITLQSQITSADLELRTVRGRMAELEAKYADYQNRVENAPRVEQEYNAILRDYKTAQAKYDETLARLQAAKEAKGLEDKRMAERLTVVEPPQVPELPARPNRLALMAVALILALGAGVGVAASAEFMDNTVRSRDDIAEITGAAVLSCIPYMATAEELARQRRRLRLTAIGLLAALAVGTAAIHFLVQPLDLVWFKIMRKLHIS